MPFYNEYEDSGLVYWPEETGITPPEEEQPGVIPQDSVVQRYGTQFNDRFDGTQGDDWYDGLGGDDTIYGYGGDDTLYGNSGNDTIFGGDGSNTIFGGDGNDVIYNLKGDIYGGNGTDILISDYSNFFTIDINSNRTLGIEMVWAGINNIIDRSITNPSAGNNKLLTYRDFAEDRLNVTGTIWDDILRGLARNDTLIGGAGNDLITSGGGDDILDGGTGIDTLGFDLSNATTNLTLNLSIQDSLQLLGNTQAQIKNFEKLERITTGSGNDTIIANNATSSSTVINTGAGDDVINLTFVEGISLGGIDAGTGIDTLILDYTNAVSPQLNGYGIKNAPNSIITLRDNQTIFSFGTSSGITVELFHFTGTQFNDEFNGRGGNDTFNGGAGNDTLNGDAGNDTLNGGVGSDTLTGGAGADFFVFGIRGVNNFSDLGIDTITDFSKGSDKIQLSQRSFNSLTLNNVLDANQFARISTNDSVMETSLAGSSNAFIVYNSSTGRLFYNSDGAVAGLGSGGQFAVLSNKPLLDNNDFSVFTTQIMSGPLPPIPVG